MPTHSIGANRELVAASLPVEVKRELGKLAFRTDTTMAKILRQLVLDAIARAKESGVLESIPVVVLTLVCLGASLDLSAFCNDEGSPVRTVRSVRLGRGKRREELDTIFDDGEGNW